MRKLNRESWINWWIVRTYTDPWSLCALYSFRFSCWPLWLVRQTPLRSRCIYLDRCSGNSDRIATIFSLSISNGNQRRHWINNETGTVSYYRHVFWNLPPDCFGRGNVPVFRAAIWMRRKIPPAMRWIFSERVNNPNRSQPRTQTKFQWSTSTSSAIPSDHVFWKNDEHRYFRWSASQISTLVLPAIGYFRHKQWDTNVHAACLRIEILKLLIIYHKL